MSIFGPDIKLIPPNRQQKWRQGWWWREKRPAIIAVVILALVAGLAVWLPFYLQDRGEDSNPRPRGSDTSQTPTPTPTGPARPAEQPPVLPDAAREETIEGIEATVRFEHEALNYAQRTGDLDPLGLVYDTAQCPPCAALVERLTGLASRGRHLEGADYVITRIKTSFIPGNNGGLLGVAVFSAKQSSDYAIVDQQGKRLETRKAQAETEFNSQLSFVGANWKIIASDVN
ncbi:MAG: DUF6318 family protein [Mycobacteriales bacterium]